jgi:hypothetical protein
MAETFAILPVKSRTARPKRKPLQFVNIGSGFKRAEENGRAYTVEYLGPISGNKNGYRATARWLRSRQVIGTRDFPTSIDAQAWLDLLRIPEPAKE